MSRQYDYWVHQQLEPAYTLTTGKATSKYDRRIVDICPQQDTRTEEEILRDEDEYLKKHGIE